MTARNVLFCFAAALALCGTASLSAQSTSAYLAMAPADQDRAVKKIVTTAVNNLLLPAKPGESEEDALTHRLLGHLARKLFLDEKDPAGYKDVRLREKRLAASHTSEDLTPVIGGYVSDRYKSFRKEGKSLEANYGLLAPLTDVMLNAFFDKSAARYEQSREIELEDFNAKMAEILLKVNKTQAHVTYELIGHLLFEAAGRNPYYNSSTRIELAMQPWEAIWIDFYEDAPKELRAFYDPKTGNLFSDKTYLGRCNVASQIEAILGDKQFPDHFVVAMDANLRSSQPQSTYDVLHTYVKSRVNYTNL